MAVVVVTGSGEEAWYDTVCIFESDGEEDFQSVPDGISLPMLCLYEYKCLRLS